MLNRTEANRTAQRVHVTNHHSFLFLLDILFLNQIHVLPLLLLHPYNCCLYYFQSLLQFPFHHIYIFFHCRFFHFFLHIIMDKHVHRYLEEVKKNNRRNKIHRKGIKPKERPEQNKEWRCQKCAQKNQFPDCRSQQQLWHGLYSRHHR